MAPANDLQAAAVNFENAVDDVVEDANLEELCRSSPPGPAPCAPPLSNRFDLLEDEEVKSPSAQPDSPPLLGWPYYQSLGDVSPSDCIPAHPSESDPDPSIPSSSLPTLANRELLETSADISPSNPADGPFLVAGLLCWFSDDLSSLDPSSIQPSNHDPNLQHPLQKKTNPQSYSRELDLMDLNQNRPLQKKTNPQSSNRGMTHSGTPRIAKSGLGSAAPRSSSVGHTPYDSRVSNLSRSR
ncbi:hypothetical protein NE237_023749 [Protea cynaroides]|uniref:Uncharacterized protein n=1 Tax=Protea cynaroides TaxID=273540 RepID=A0A9Q0HDH6_9MAGN|nr:hypothetical protein NE237_023749 [Protea cynaroides]